MPVTDYNAVVAVSIFDSFCGPLCRFAGFFKATWALYPHRRLGLFNFYGAVYCFTRSIKVPEVGSRCSFYFCVYFNRLRAAALKVQFKLRGRDTVVLNLFDSLFDGDIFFDSALGGFDCFSILKFVSYTLWLAGLLA
jgi:hypothetical protein